MTGPSAHFAETPSPSDAPARSIRWRHAVYFVLALLAARILYLWLLSPWELVADESHYWEWSRRPDWSYYTKGPGVAWVIWLSTHLFSNGEGAVRLPSAIASASMTLAGARLAFEISGRNAKAALYAVIALAVCPAYFGMAQLLTTDVFWSAGWVITTWFVYRATLPARSAASRIGFWAAAGFTIGLTCLFKYTALFFLPGVVLFLILRRREVRFDRALWLGLVASVVAMVIAASPILIWNATRGWPTIAHQVGRVRLPGGDETVDWSWSPIWFLSFAGAQLALMAVVGVQLMVMAILRERKNASIATDVPRRVGTTLLLCASLPLVGFYLLLSLARQAQGNWAIAGYATLLVLVGIFVAETLDDDANAQATPLPNSPVRGAWHWYIGIGIVVALFIAAGPALLKVPELSKIDLIKRASKRNTGARQHALDVAAIAEAHRDAAGRLPLLIASRYQEASLLAYYMPGHPIVFCAGSHLGSRRTAYDFFADTNLADPALRGRTALFIGGDLEDWKQGFHFASIESVPGSDVRLVNDFEGPTGEPLR